MKKIIPVLFILLLLAAACGDEPEAAPTPFPPTPTPAAALRQSQAFPVTAQDLLLNPEMYRDALVQVTGRYERRPLLVCESAAETYPSPAAWALKGENGMILEAGEYDDTLRALLPDGLTITVTGYWEEWQGIVGCGKQAEPATLWYLKVTDIVSPSPLAQVTLTPGGEMVGGDDGGDTAVNPQTPGATPIAETGGLLPTATSDSAGAPSPTAVNGAATPTPNPGLAAGTPTPLPGGGTTVPTPTFTPQIGATPTTAVTPSPAGATPTPGGATATPGGGATATPRGAPTATLDPLATATNSPGNLTDVAMDDVYTDDAWFGALSGGEKHIWNVELEDSRTITLSVAVEPQMSVTFDLVDENGVVVASQDVPAGGKLGTAAGISVDPTLLYTLEIYSPDGSAGDYAITLWGDDEFSVPNEARGFLEYGQMGSASLPADGASHYWFFYGQAGETVDVVTSSEPDRLLLVSLYDGQGNVVLDANGDDVEWVDEEALGVPLPRTGLYAIWLIENDFQSSNYTIQVSQN